SIDRRGVAGQKLGLVADEVVCAVVPLEYPRVTGLHDDDVLAVAGFEVLHVELEVLKCAMPPWVVGQADDVEGDIAGGQAVEEPAAGGVVASAVDVDHDGDGLAGFEGIVYSIDSGDDEFGQLIPLGVVVELPA